MENKTLYIVHCVDTEGPLNENLEATFDRLKSIFDIELTPTKANLKSIQNKEFDLAGQEEAVAKCFAPNLLKYNSNWNDINRMLDKIMSKNFRSEQLDDYGNGWIYSWHCMDHVDYSSNPRNKATGYGTIFRFYVSKLLEYKCNQDEINWHFHPLSITKNPLNSATSYVNNYERLMQILCRRVLDENWFPVVNRPGFHSERPDSHLFLEQWIPFDYANQACEANNDQPDLSFGRFGDWTRAPISWRGYNPSHDDYQTEGYCRRTIFRCLNIGTRLRSLTKNHVREAFNEANNSGSAILAFANHDYRDMQDDISHIRKMISEIKNEFNDVKIKYSGAENAAKSLMNYHNELAPKLNIFIKNKRLFVELAAGKIFGPQPFLAIKTRDGEYFHDNLDIIVPKAKWSYVFDDQTIEMHNILKVGVGTAGFYGNYCVVNLDLENNLK